jgi:hypothetical protein
MSLLEKFEKEEEKALVIVGYQLPTKLLKLFLPSYNYLTYLCYMHILLRLQDMFN